MKKIRLEKKTFSSCKSSLHTLEHPLGHPPPSSLVPTPPAPLFASYWWHHPPASFSCPFWTLDSGRRKSGGGGKWQVSPTHPQPSSRTSGLPSISAHWLQAGWPPTPTWGPCQADPFHAAEHRQAPRIQQQQQQTAPCPPRCAFESSITAEPPSLSNQSTNI